MPPSGVAAMMRLPIIVRAAEKMCRQALATSRLMVFVYTGRSGGREKSVPLVEYTAACGFPSPADDYLKYPQHVPDRSINRSYQPWLMTTFPKWARLSK